MPTNKRVMVATANSLPGGWLESGHGSVSVFVKDFRDPLERKKKLVLKPWASVKDIKDQLQVVFNVPTNAQKLFYQGRELKNAHNLEQCGIFMDNAILDFVARRSQNLAMLYSLQSDQDRESGERERDRRAQAIKATVAGNIAGKAPELGTNASTMAPSDGTKNGVSDRRAGSINIHPYGAHVLPMSLLKVLHQALQGLALGFAPILAMDGTGGTYFLKDPTHRTIGCFKPQDEEPFAPNNPRGLVGELGQSGLRRGILSGEACERELAAYLLDRDHFAGVPATSLVEARHPSFKSPDCAQLGFKVGSLQEFVRHEEVVSDLAPSRFTTHQVHKIVLLDMRLLNTDRNDANILVRKRRSASVPTQSEYELIPIDHGYCLPHVLEIAWCDWCWYGWPQLMVPLSPDDRKYVLSLNVFEEAERLSKKIPLRRACRRNLVIAGTLLHKGVQANLLLHDIATIMCRDDLDTPSTLERMCIDAFHALQRHKRLDMVPPLTLTAPNGSNKRSGAARTLSLDMSIVNAGNGLNSPASQNGLRSPPGFWASLAPFGESSSDEEDDQQDHDEETNCEHATGNGKAHSSVVHWNQVASNALDIAVTRTVDVEDDHIERASVMSSTFGGDNEDEFDVLNEALDANAQDERAFLNLLGRYMDEKIEECRHNHKKR